MTENRVFNFAAGPGVLPEEVLKESQKDLVNYKGCGRSVMELSHRSKVFEAIIQKAEDDLRTLLSIPSTHKVLFMQGGGTGQFACVPLNLLGKKTKAAYAVTGCWSQKAFKEAKKYCDPVMVCNGIDGKFTGIPPQSEWKEVTDDMAYLYYCANETVDGVEFQDVPKVPPGTVLVADMSSNFLSRPIPVSSFGCIVVGAQKNCGIAGVTLVIVREDLLSQELPITPTVMSYKITSDNQSLFNTPPTFGIYMSGLVFQWLLQLGGIDAMERLNKEKSSLIYSLLSPDGFYSSTVEKSSQSRMNITFRLKNRELEEPFLKEATAQGLIELKGHRSVGGIRASLYNAMSLEGTKALADFMQHFRATHS